MPKQRISPTKMKSNAAIFDTGIYVKLVTLPFLMFGFVATCPFAYAEGGCPPGQIPYSGTNINSCAPIPGYNQQQSSQTITARPPEWESRWGAIVTDAEKGVIGSATGRKRKSEAKNAAIADCEAHGGTRCSVQMEYKNGCASLIVGDDIFHVTADATKEDAERVGIESCSGKTTNCRAFFTACSPPVQIR